MDDSKLRAVLTAVQCGSFGKAPRSWDIHNPP